MSEKEEIEQDIALAEEKLELLRKKLYAADRVVSIDITARQAAALVAVLELFRESHAVMIVDAGYAYGLTKETQALLYMLAEQIYQNMNEAGITLWNQDMQLRSFDIIGWNSTNPDTI